MYMFRSRFLLSAHSFMTLIVTFKTNIVSTCLDLTSLGNGGISYSPSSTPRRQGTVATHTCNTGYVLSGGSSRTCQSNRLWSGSLITCLGT